MTATIEEMTDKLVMYVSTRQIGIAELMAKEFADEHSKSPFQESGYAILSIAMAYFEMIEQFLRGEDSDGKSKAFFRGGFKQVYLNTSLGDSEIDDLYRLVRCGMYHGGMTRQTLLSRYFDHGFELVGGAFHINPAKVVAEIQAHFQEYVGWLRDPICTAERENFEKLCIQLGFDEAPSPVVISSTATSTKTTPNPMEAG